MCNFRNPQGFLLLFFYHDFGLYASPPAERGLGNECGREISRGFAKTSSALKPHALPECLEGRTPKEKHPFLFQKKFTPAKSEMQGVFFLSGLPSGARRWRGFLRAYDSVSLHHVLRACHIICF